MTTDAEIKAELSRLAAVCEQAQEEAKALCKGREIRILSKFNGQPCGCSRPVLTGKVFTVGAVCIDHGAAFVLPGKSGAYAKIDEVEFLEEAK